MPDNRRDVLHVDRADGRSAMTRDQLDKMVDSSEIIAAIVRIPPDKAGIIAFDLDPTTMLYLANVLEDVAKDLRREAKQGVN